MIQREVSQDEMRRKIQELEDLLIQLRVGRRILMNLLEVTQEEKNLKIQELEKENQELKRKNRKYAEALTAIRWRTQ